MQRRVEVAVRVRPAGHDAEDCASVESDDPRVLRVVDHSGLSAAGQTRRFAPDLLFAPEVTNADIFAQLIEAPLREATVAQPDTLCFLAYGHTNSGKTHTITGGAHEKGVLTLCVEELLRRDGAVEVAMVEVYMDQVYDLLAEGRLCRIRRRAPARAARMQTGHTPEPDQGGAARCSSPQPRREAAAIVVEGLTTCLVTSAAEWDVVAQFGLHSRRTAPTERNARSSRSHAIFTVKTPGVRLCFVDLAGSERQTVFSPRLNQESISINKSLSRLSTVLEALSHVAPVPTPGKDTARHAAPYVNFRDTTLTVLLQRYLCGAARTTFLACIHPAASFYAETISTLRYIQRLRRIKTRRTPPGLNAAEMSGLLGQGVVLRDAAELQSLVQRSGLVAELLRLRQAMDESRETSRVVQEAQQARIHALEAQLAQQAQDKAPPSQAMSSEALHLHKLNSDASDMHAAGEEVARATTPQAALLRRVHETRRLMNWLLRRAVAHLPSLHVSFDQYFDDLLSSGNNKNNDRVCEVYGGGSAHTNDDDEGGAALQVIGYVSTMSCLPPRPTGADVGRASEEPRFAFLDVGDFALALTMLDGGVPPRVALHVAGRCRRAACWDSQPVSALAETTTPTTRAAMSEGGRSCESDAANEGQEEEATGLAEAARANAQAPEASEEATQDRVYALAFFVVTPGLTVVGPSRPQPPALENSERGAADRSAPSVRSAADEWERRAHEGRARKEKRTEEKAWLPCCDGYCACEPLLPLAVVVAVRSEAAPTTKECVLRRLLALHSGQARARAALNDDNDEHYCSSHRASTGPRMSDSDVDCDTDTELAAATRRSERGGGLSALASHDIVIAREGPHEQEQRRQRGGDADDVRADSHYPNSEDETSDSSEDGDAGGAVPVISPPSTPPPRPTGRNGRPPSAADERSESNEATDDVDEAAEENTRAAPHDKAASPPRAFSPSPPAPLLLLSPPSLPHSQRTPSRPSSSALRTSFAVPAAAAVVGQTARSASSSSSRGPSPCASPAAAAAENAFVTTSHYLLPASPPPPMARKVSRSASRLTKDDSLDTPGLSRERGGAANTPDEMHGPLTVGAEVRVVRPEAVACPARVMQDVVDAMRGASTAMMVSPSSVPMSVSRHDGRTSLTSFSSSTSSSSTSLDHVKDERADVMGRAASPCAHEPQANRAASAQCPPPATTAAAKAEGRCEAYAAKAPAALPPTSRPVFSAQEERAHQAKVVTESVAQTRRAGRRRCKAGHSDAMSTSEEKAVKFDACSTCRVA